MAVDAQTLKDALLEGLLGDGCVAAGSCSAEPFVDTRIEIERRKASGESADLTFTFNDPNRSTDVHQSFPWATTLVVGAWSYAESAGSPGASRPATGRIARFATEDHYRGLRRALHRCAAGLRTRGYLAEVLVDDNRLVDRAAAVRAGIGWWGKNTMILTPKWGPWMLLGSVATDAALPASSPSLRDCGSCAACLPACPTGALVAPGVLDARTCLAYWLQTSGVIPLNLRRPLGDRIYGCDDCLEACPPGRRLIDAATATAGRRDLLSLWEMSDSELLAEFDHFYVPRRKANILRRNIVVALGNCGDERADELLQSLLSDADWLLRAHAVWALAERIGDACQPDLLELARVETRDEVRTEIARVVSRAGEPMQGNNP